MARRESPTADRTDESVRYEQVVVVAERLQRTSFTTGKWMNVFFAWSS